MSVFTKDENNFSFEKRNRDWKIWFLCFLSFCFIGWIYEVLVFKFELGYGFVNRGFLFGPWLPVYGFGGMIILFSMKKLKMRKIRIGKANITPFLCFFSIILLCTAVELLTSYLMEFATGSWLWDYTNDGPNNRPKVFGMISYLLIGLFLMDVAARFFVGGNYVGP